MDLVNLANSILEQDEEINYLRREVARLGEYEAKYHELVQEGIAHSRHMIDGLLSIALVPGVMEAIGEHNQRATPDAH